MLNKVVFELLINLIKVLILFEYLNFLFFLFCLLINLIERLLIKKLFFFNFLVIVLKLNLVFLNIL